MESINNKLFFSSLVSKFLSLERPRPFDCNMQVFIRRWVDCERCLLYTFPLSVIRTVIGWPKGSLIGWPIRSVIGSFYVFPYVVQLAWYISIPLYLLMLFGWSLIWMASLTLREHQWESFSRHKMFFQSGEWPVLLVCSETAEIL